MYSIKHKRKRSIENNEAKRGGHHMGLTSSELNSQRNEWKITLEEFSKVSVSLVNAVIRYYWQASLGYFVSSSRLFRMAQRVLNLGWKYKLTISYAGNWRTNLYNVTVGQFKKKKRKNFKHKLINYLKNPNKTQRKRSHLWWQVIFLFRINILYCLVLLQEWRPMYVKVDSC